MSAPVRFALIMSVTEHFDPFRITLDARVQCWAPDGHIVTIDLIDHAYVELPAEVDTDIVENYAVAAAREAARRLAETQMSAVEKEIVNRRAEIAEAPRHV